MSSVSFDQKLQTEALLGVLRNYNSKLMNLGRNATVFQEGKKETEFMKTEKVGASKGVTQFF